MDLRNEAMKERARRSFEAYGQDFEAYLIQNDKNYLIFDWQDRNGSGNMATRYIVSKITGTLVITGDSGECIAEWNNEIDPVCLSHNLNSISYFVEKIRCCRGTSRNGPYTYNGDDIRFDIDKYFYKHNYLEIAKKIDEEYEEWEFKDDVKRLKEIAYDYAGGVWPNEYSEIAEKLVGPDWLCTEIGCPGERIDIRVYQWAYGYQIGIERLIGQGELKAEEGDG